MKTYLIILSILFLFLNSCIVEDESTFITTVLENNSNYEIKIYTYYENKLFDSLIIIKDNSYEQLETGITLSRGGFFGGDSLIVVFGDSITITHWSNDYSHVARNLYSEEFYLKEEIREKEFRCEYAFTDDDYQEALDKQ